MSAQREKFAQDDPFELHGKSVKLYWGVDSAANTDKTTRVLMAVDQKSGKSYIIDVFVHEKSKPFSKEDLPPTPFLESLK